MTTAELANFDGQNGRKAYIAVNGKIYDVTDSPRWQNGLHPPDHRAGQDLTDELATAPHVRAVVERFPFVGSLEDDTAESALSGKITVGIIIVAVIVAIIIFLLL